MNRSKLRLIMSVISLIAACALAIATVYAWFYTNETAKTDGIETQTTTGDVVYFNITAFYAESVDGKTFKYVPATDESNAAGDPSSQAADSSGDFQMHPYRPRVGDSTGTTTAIILKMQFQISVDGDFELRACLNSDDVFAPNFGGFTEKNHLSNAVYLQELATPDDEKTDSHLEINDTDYTVVDDTQQTFLQVKNFSDTLSENIKNYNDNKLKNTKLDLKTYTNLKANDISNDKDYYVRYYIMDYKPDYISSLYNMMLSATNDETLNSFSDGDAASFKAATLNTTIQFKKDIYFTLGRAE